MEGRAYLGGLLPSKGKFYSRPEIRFPNKSSQDSVGKSPFALGVLGSMLIIKRIAQKLTGQTKCRIGDALISTLDSCMGIETPEVNQFLSDGAISLLSHQIS
jgi:hypothetical protein